MFNRSWRDLLAKLTPIGIHMRASCRLCLCSRWLCKFAVLTNRKLLDLIVTLQYIFYDIDIGPFLHVKYGCRFAGFTFFYLFLIGIDCYI